MKTTSISFAALAAIMLFGTGDALAASPKYCDAYADAYSKQAEEQLGAASLFIRDRAYHICLNLDDEPTLPTEEVDLVADGIADPINVADNSASYRARDVDGRRAAIVAPAIAEKTIDEAPVEETSSEASSSEEETMAEVEATATDDTMVDEHPVEEATAPEPDPQGRIVANLEKWSPEWRAWCKAHYPNSFDLKTGTVVPYDTGIRTEC